MTRWRLRRRPTYREELHGKPPGVDALVNQWSDELIQQLLGLVWDAYDDVHRDVWSRVDWTRDYGDLERSLSEDLARAINGRMDDFLPVHVMHGPSERESRAAPPAQPPEYDIAFQWSDNPLLMWPLEAKVLKSDRDTEDNLKDYTETVRDRYLTGYYAPFSNGGAMLGYLKAGDPEIVAGHIATRLGVALVTHTAFPNRCHKTSDHRRTIPVGKDYPLMFRLHHLVLRLGRT
jgi:hypothetical protein